MISSSQHGSEVERGERFEFGKNWSRFLATLNEHRIGLAVRSLASFLESDRLDGRTFLDVGSGSGLFSLAARRLGAKVHSFDYDPHSVACTRELKQRYFLNDPDWTIEQGSVLDAAFLARLGSFDVVYSWGVLHHTGAMWKALESVKPLVGVGGKLFIAIYNDLGSVTDQWEATKRTYNRLPAPLARAYALGIIAREESLAILGHARGKSLGDWLRTWTAYPEVSTRGMSRWHDWIDWIGGYPYERASVEAIVDVFARDGFRLNKLEDRTSGYGCNEFVFYREGSAGTYIDSPLPSSPSLSRRVGRRILGPFELTPEGYVGRLTSPPGEGRFYLFRDDTPTSPAVFLNETRVVVAAPDSDPALLDRSGWFAVPGALRNIERPFQHQGGQLWRKNFPDLAHLAEDAAGSGPQTRVHLYEDGRALPFPGAVHAEIARQGRGRFSHWGTYVYFSSADGSDPNVNGRAYSMFVPLQA